MNVHCNEELYYSIKEACDLLCVSSQTLRKWDKAGKLRAARLPSRVRIFRRKDVHAILGFDPSAPTRHGVVYARVSSAHQKDDLARQIAFLQSKYPDYDVVKDVASGINWKRKGLQALLEQVVQGTVSEIVVAHKDRLARFAYDLLVYVCQLHGTRIIVVDDHDHGKSTEQELAEDLLSIVHIYTCRHMGKRRYTKNGHAQPKNSDLSDSTAKDHSA